MTAVDDALARLKRAIQKSKSKCMKDQANTLSQITSYLKSSALSSDASTKLCDVLRRRLPMLYSTYPQSALELTSELCRTFYDDKILKDFTAGSARQESRWEYVLNASLSGVLDILDAEPTDKFKEAIGTSLYPTLCSILSSASITHMSAELRCTGFSVLADSAEAHKANQKRLLQASLLGGMRLGSIIWRTKDYLVLESVLNLFARMIPTSGSSSAGRATRRAFIRSVFVDSSPDDLGTGEELANTVEHVTTSDWEETSAKIVDTLAGSNIGFPQPFKVSEVFVGEESSPSDRVYVDGQGFLANVLVGEELFDSLAAPYSTVAKIEIQNRSFIYQSTTQHSYARVIVTLTSRPTIGQKPAHTQTTPTLTFSIDESDVQRLHAALNSRGMGNIITVHSTTKQSVPLSPAALEIDLAGNLIGQNELEQRIENLSQFYETNEPNDDLNIDLALKDDQIQCIDPSLLSLLPSRHTVSPVSSAQKLSGPLPRALVAGSTPKLTTVLDGIFATADGVSTPLASALMTPTRRTTSQILRDKAFGTSDDDLSELEHPPSPPKVPRKSVMNALPVNSNGLVGTVLRTKGRVVLDSDDDIPASTPSRPPLKKVVLVSDDEIEEVVSANRPTVSRRRSVLAMTAVTPRGPSSSSRRRSFRSQLPHKKSAAVAAAVPGNSSDQPIVLDSPVKLAFDAPVAADEVVAKNNCLAEAKAKVEALEQVPAGSPPVQPIKKGVKSALRKKGQLFDTSAAVPLASKGTKRKQIPDISEDAVPLKRVRPSTKPTSPTDASLAKAGPPMFGPDLVSSGRAKKRYGGRKKRDCSPPSAPIEPIIDYDVIPGPANSTSKSVKSKPKPKAAKTKPTPKEPTEAVEKVTSVEVKAAKKATRTAVTKGKESDAKATSKEENKGTTQKAQVKSTAVEQQEPFGDKTFGDHHVVGEPAESFVHKEVCVPKELSTPQGSPNVTHSVNIIDPLNISKDTSSCKKSNKAPWNVPGAAKIEHPGDITSIAMHDNAPKLQTESTLSPEVSDILYDTGPAIVPPDDFINPINAERTPTTTEVESHQLGSAPPSRPVVEIVMDHPVRATPENTQLARRAIDGSLVRRDMEELNAAPKDTIKIPILEPVDQRSLDLTNIKAPILGHTKTKAVFTPIFPHSYKHLESTPKNTLKKARFEYPERRLEKQLDAPPGMEDLANVLQQIQRAVLHKITNRVEGARHEVLRGRALMLEEAAADLVAMREESIDRYNHLIELEADYASFGRELIHALDDLTTSNKIIKGDLEKIIQAHNRGSIVKHAPTSLFPAKLPASIKRLCF